jgi:hypothetical protein
MNRWMDALPEEVVLFLALAALLAAGAPNRPSGWVAALFRRLAGSMRSPGVARR